MYKLLYNFISFQGKSTYIMKHMLLISFFFSCFCYILEWKDRFEQSTFDRNLPDILVRYLYTIDALMVCADVARMCLKSRQTEVKYCPNVCCEVHLWCVSIPKNGSSGELLNLVFIFNMDNPLDLLKVCEHIKYVL